MMEKWKDFLYRRILTNAEGMIELGGISFVAILKSNGLGNDHQC